MKYLCQRAAEDDMELQQLDRTARVNGRQRKGGSSSMHTFPSKGDNATLRAGVTSQKMVALEYLQQEKKKNENGTTKRTRQR